QRGGQDDLPQDRLDAPAAELRPDRDLRGGRRSAADRVRPYIAVVPQEGKPFFHLTPREQVYTYLRARGLARETARARTESAIEQMGLESVADRLAITLSGGQRQRTMVA
ncbi:daunorubicin resistance protein related protein, partial [mine drainage metagenome]